MKDNLLHTILLSTERAANVVKDVRSFINKGVTPERLSIDLEKNIRVVLNVFNHELRKQLKLDTSFEDGLFIQGYDIKLFQLWSNLIKNAIDAMEENSNKQIRIETKSDSESIIVIVSNNGPKIPETIQSQIFNKFFSTKRDKNGTGLGLSIVKNVIDEHNAKISLDSNDEWTSFKIEFPIEKMN
jgi:signal transduction histidine kinase